MNIRKIAGRLLVVGVLSGLGYAGVTTFQTHRAVDSARRENMALKARQEALRTEAFELGERAADAALLGRWMAARSAGANRQVQPRMTCTPSRDASNESIIRWLTSERAQLETVEHDLSAADERTGAPLASAPAGTPAASTDDRSTVRESASSQ